MADQTIETTCCVVGGGPAGVMLGFLLAREGVEVTVLEKHKDFFRDFRGDTVHPSTLEVLYELGIIDEFLQIPHQELRSTGGLYGDFAFKAADFSSLPTHCKCVVLMPQWDFLNFLSAKAKKFPNFHLRMENEATGLINEGGRIRGVMVNTPDGPAEIRADLVVGCDGRHSVTREAAHFEVIESGVYSDGHFPGKTYRDYLESQKSSGENPGGFTPYLQGALVSLDAHTGAILAMVGGRDFDDSKYNRVTQSRRQAGSTFKPFVYSAAIRAGHTTTEILDDSPLTVPVLQPDSTLWNPKDDDDTIEGLIPLRQALYNSRNLATIKLGMSLGEQTVIGEARRYGITTPIPVVPSIHIGSSTVNPLEMVAAYTAFATLGTRSAAYGIDYVEDAKGNVLYRSSPDRTEVMDSSHTWLMVDMMKDVIRRGTAFTAVWKAGFQLPAAGKTGTTDTYTDAWFIGYTPQIVTGVWVGYDLIQPILPHNAGGGKIAAPAWTALMKDVYDRRPAPADWPRPDSLITREVDRSNGFLATPFCPDSLHHWDWYYPGTEPTKLCPVHSGLGGISP